MAPWGGVRVGNVSATAYGEWAVFGREWYAFDGELVGNI